MGLKRDFAWMLSSRGSTIAAGFVTGALINRALGPAGRGVYAEMQTWVALFIAVFGLSLDSGINHFANRERYGGDDRRRFATTFILTTALGFVAMAALAGFVAISPGYFSSRTIELLGPLSALMLFTMLASNGTVLLLALNEAKAAALVGLVQTALGAAVIMGGYALGIIGIGFLVGNLIFIQSVSLVLTWGVFHRRGAASTAVSREMAAGMLRAGGKLHVATIATYVYTRLNQLIVFRYCGEAEAGLFAVALNMAFYALFIPATLQTVLYPRVIHFSDDYEVTVRTMRMMFYGWGGLSLLMAAAARPLLLLYGGGAFADAVNVFRVLMVAAWLLPISSLFAPYFVKHGAFLVASMTAVVLGAASLGLNLWLVPRYASMGAAAATAATCATGFGMVLLFMRYLTGRNPLEIFRLSLEDFRLRPAGGTPGGGGGRNP